MNKTNDFNILVSVRIPVPLEKVYKAWTDQEQISKWFCGDQGFTPGRVEMDHRVGGRFSATLNILNESFVVSGEYKEIVPYEKIVFTQGWEDPLRYQTLVTVEFRKKEFGTEVLVTQENITNADEAEGHRLGWQSALDRLAQTLSE